MTATDEIALTNGNWRPVGGVLRWFPTLTSVPEIREIDVSTLIACPSCHAKVTETCRTKSGHRTTPHLSRLAPRLCPCGARVGPQKRYCPPCRDEADRVSKRESRVRIAAARRARKANAA